MVFFVSLRIVFLLILLGKHVTIADYNSLILPSSEDELLDIKPTNNTDDFRIPSSELLDIKPINNTGDFRITIKDAIGKPWDDHIVRCVRPAKCEKLQNSTCFGGKLPYKQTSSQLSNEEGQDKILEKLHQFEAIKYVPKCWTVIQVSCFVDFFELLSSVCC